MGCTSYKRTKKSHLVTGEPRQYPVRTTRFNLPLNRPKCTTYKSPFPRYQTPRHMLLPSSEGAPRKLYQLGDSHSKMSFQIASFSFQFQRTTKRPSKSTFSSSELHRDLPCKQCLPTHPREQAPSPLLEHLG